MAVMLRSVGVPARVAVGFTGGAETGDHRTVSTSDAHAWVEAWFPGYGWMIFDPTPLTDGRTIVPPYVAEAEAQAAGDASQASGADPRDDAQQTPTPEATPTPTPATPDVAAPETPPSETPVGLLGLVAVVLLVVGAALLPAALRRRERRGRLAAAAAGGPEAAAAAWAELLAESSDRGVPPRESDTVRVAARRLVREHNLGGPAQQELRRVVGAVEASWYGDTHLGPGELDEPLTALLAAVAAGTPLSWRGRLFPRSVLSGLGRRLSRKPPAPDDSTTTHDNAAAPTGRGGGVT